MNQGNYSLQRLCMAVTEVLTLPPPATSEDEVTYLRISRDRARLVAFACRRISEDTERGMDEALILEVVRQMKGEAQQMSADQYTHNSLVL